MPEPQKLEMQRLSAVEWKVKADGLTIGFVHNQSFGDQYYATTAKGISPDFPTRTQCVHWLVDQREENNA